MKRRVVITGMGVVSWLGIGVDVFGIPSRKAKMV